MSIDPVSILRKHQHEPALGSVAKQAIGFLESAECKFLQSPGPGQSSFDVVRMYEIRMSLKKFRRDAFIGLEESIKSLGERDINVHLAVIETEKGLISIWLADETDSPMGIIITKFDL